MDITILLNKNTNLLTLVQVLRKFGSEATEYFLL